MSTPRIVTQRACRPCTACCRLLNVSELHSPCGFPCQYEDKGCGLKGYKRRPAQCSAFQCTWKLGEGQRGDRPDQLGVLLWMDDTTPEWGSIARLYETWGGAAKSPAVRDFIVRLELLTKYITVMNPFDHRVGFRVLGGPQPLTSDFVKEQRRLIRLKVV